MILKWQRTTSKVGDKSIKFTVNTTEFINSFSKRVAHGVAKPPTSTGTSEGSWLFKTAIRECAAGDYFEKRLEPTIERGLKLSPIDGSDYAGMEIDFPADLEAARKLLDAHAL